MQYPNNLIASCEPAMQQERRASPRKDLMRIGEIFFDHARLTVNCIVRNYSDAGALIEVRST